VAIVCITINWLKLDIQLIIMKIFLPFLLLVFFIPAAAQIPAGVSAKTNLYFVRHAEKEAGTDPVLTTNGNKRAGDLMRTLKNKNIKRIYVTQFKRTQMTADSMRLQLGIDTVHYNADENGIDLFNKIAAHGDFNKTILIVGHSNTVPDYIKKAGVTNYPQANILDTEFDNLFKVCYTRRFVVGAWRAHVKKRKYGEASGVSGAMQ
jgi:2,3-bisphosphoglycerate-dependent phosphoglycerate mutase